MKTSEKITFFAFFLLMNLGFGIGCFLFGLLGNDYSAVQFGDRYYTFLTMSLIFMFGGLSYIILTAINLTKLRGALVGADLQEQVGK
jgi:hypothetical protein